MRQLRVLGLRLRSLFRRQAVETELERELAFHLEQLTREKMAAGLSEPEARRAARRAFGPPDLAAEGCRDARRLGLLEDPQVAMKSGRVAPSGTPGGLLVTAQVALSLVLLVAAAMFGHTMVNLRTADLGFSGKHVVTMSLDPVVSAETVSRPQLWRQVMERIRALPGVRAASLSVLTPLSGRDTSAEVTAPGFEPRADSQRRARLNHVSEGYFRTFGIELRAGRAFTPRDTAVGVAVVNEAAAADYFRGQAAIGKTLVLGERRYQVVGVVRDHKHLSLREPAPRFVFIPLWQPLDPISRITLAVASDQPPAAMARAVAHEVHALHARTLVSDVISIEDQIDATLLSERLLSIMAIAFAALALSLAAVGLFGVLSYAVARRRPELAVRMALGSPPAHIASAVLRQGLVQVAAGVALGLPLALALARSAGGLLFELEPGDPRSYAMSTVALVVVGALAAWLPARRAATIDPAETLRHTM